MKITDNASNQLLIEKLSEITNEIKEVEEIVSE